MDLKELLGEELYNLVTEKAGEHKIAVVSDGNWFPKEKFDTVNNDNKELKKQLKSRDDQLEELKKVDAEGLQQKILDLQKANEDAEKEWQSKLAQQKFDFSLKDALISAKVRNPKAVKALLNLESIKLDGDKLLGLEEQLNTIKESDPYLFEEEQQDPSKPSFTTGKHQTGGGIGEPTNLAEALSQHFSQQQ
ncbi:phage scaffolding protein [Bacillus nitroreducens]